MSIAVIQGVGGAIGSSFARHLLRQTSLQIVGTSRNRQVAEQAVLSESDSAKFRDRFSVLEVDSKDEATIEKAAKDVKERWGQGSLRLLLNVSGVLHADKSVQNIDHAELLESFQLNTFGHILTLKHFLPLLPTKRQARNLHNEETKDPANGLVKPGLSVVASLTARVGSISDNRKGGWMAYRASKAATNQVMRTVALELEHRSTAAIAVSLHPGTVVGTNLSSPWTRVEDAGRKRGTFTADESARRLLDVVARLGEADNGTFLDWDGRQVGW
ncbi:putative Rossman fold oxidoreductase [Meredithblackwellia eburnea MCA 4105]